MMTTESLLKAGLCQKAAERLSGLSRFVSPDTMVKALWVLDALGTNGKGWHFFANIEDDLIEMQHPWLEAHIQVGFLLGRKDEADEFSQEKKDFPGIAEIVDIFVKK